MIIHDNTVFRKMNNIHLPVILTFTRVPGLWKPRGRDQTPRDSNGLKY